MLFCQFNRMITGTVSYAVSNILSVSNPSRLTDRMALSISKWRYVSNCLCHQKVTEGASAFCMKLCLTFPVKHHGLSLSAFVPRWNYHLCSLLQSRTSIAMGEKMWFKFACKSAAAAAAALGRPNPLSNILSARCKFVTCNISDLPLQITVHYPIKYNRVVC